MTAERAKEDSQGEWLQVGSATPREAYVARDQTIVGWEIKAETPEMARVVADTVNEITGGEMLTEVKASGKNSKNFTTGLGGNHPKKSTWHPSGSAWGESSKKDFIN